MGFDLEAFLGRGAEMRGWTRELPSAVVCGLSGELGMVPLTGRLLRDLAARLDAAEKFRTYPSPSMREGVRRWGARASRGTAVAHVSTGEFGDTSYETAMLWVDGELVLPATGLREALAYLRDTAGIRFDTSAIDLEIHRGEDAAEKWAAAAPRLPPMR